MSPSPPRAATPQPPRRDPHRPAPAAAGAAADAPLRSYDKPATIRFSQCDPAGIVFFPNYLVMINDLNEEWVGHLLGTPYADMVARRQIGLPTVSLQCEFTAVSRMGEQVLLTLAVERLGARSITLRHECRCGSELRYRMRQVLVMMNLATQRAVDVPADLRAAIAAFQSP